MPACEPGPFSSKRITGGRCWLMKNLLESETLFPSQPALPKDGMPRPFQRAGWGKSGRLGSLGSATDPLGGQVSALLRTSVSPPTRCPCGSSWGLLLYCPGISHPPFPLCVPTTERGVGIRLAPSQQRAVTAPVFPPSQTRGWIFCTPAGLLLGCSLV
ncbi:unnamed protein product [Natator depressus]